MAKIPHPIYSRQKEVEKTIAELEEVESDESYMDWMCDDILCIGSKLYRRKIKGYHLAFNVRERLEDDLSNYKY